MRGKGELIRSVKECVPVDGGGESSKEECRGHGVADKSVDEDKKYSRDGRLCHGVAGDVLIVGGLLWHSE